MSAPAPTNTVTTLAPAASNQVSSPSAEVVPSAATLVSAAKLAIQKDMPIQLDYFVDSAEGKAFLGEDAQTNDKMLVKNSEEYTSHIQKIYKAGEDFIILTENSIYLASSKIQKRKIQASNLRGE
ncbi:MAG: hypothetical protein EB127_12955 [Alphaproteobacteria bacterium]|nr:hypothetical protein [Alphaproteobacteria bacterium]